MRSGPSQKKITALLPPRTNVEIPKGADERVKWVSECLRRSSLGRPVRIEDIARSVHMSSSHLRHLFRSEVGLSPSRYVKLLRLEKAKYLIGNSFLEVKEIAGAVGFGDVSHFVRDYKSVYGERPSQTRTRRKAG
jgi:transcriptional regulator GlxA family with amidase domain